jgi:hypothetical protein
MAKRRPVLGLRSSARAKWISSVEDVGAADVDERVAPGVDERAETPSCVERPWRRGVEPVEKRCVRHQRRVGSNHRLRNRGRR